MPIVISYDNVGALGGLAFGSGYQEGVAQGQTNYYGRQEQDTQLMMRNAFDVQSQQRQFAFQNQQNQQHFAMQQNAAMMQRQFEGQQQQNRLGFQGYEDQQNRNAALQHLQMQDQFRQGMQQNSFGFKQGMQEQQSKNADEHIDRKFHNREAASQEKYQAAEDDYVQGQQAQGDQRDPTAIRSEYKQSYARHFAGMSNKQPQNQIAPEAATQGGRFGVGAANSGNFGMLKQVEDNIYNPAQKAVFHGQAVIGMISTMVHKDSGSIKAALNNPQVPDEVKSGLIQELTRRGEWSTGANQAPSQAGSPGQQGVQPSRPPSGGGGGGLMHGLLDFIGMGGGAPNPGVPGANQQPSQAGSPGQQPQQQQRPQTFTSPDGKKTMQKGPDGLWYEVPAGAMGGDHPDLYGPMKGYQYNTNSP